MANFEGGSTTNFLVATSGQTNAFFLPEVYSKKVQNFFRKASVVEAITNSDYTGEISSFGDTVNIIKEPTITTYDYTRGLDTTQAVIGDQELTLIVDQARAFKFIVDDIESRMSHVNFKEVASSSAAYSLKDQLDSNVLTYMAAQFTAANGSSVIGADDATAGSLADVDGGATEAVNIDTTATDSSDPIDVLARCARLLDDNNVPEEGRWFAAKPEFYEILSQSASKLMSVDYNAGQGSIRNGLVTSGLLRGFKMYKSNNMPEGTNAHIALAGHMSAVATAGTILKTETFRDPNSFGDVVRGLHVYGRKVLRNDAAVKVFWNTSTDA
jgi:hypothetical protein